MQTWRHAFNNMSNGALYAVANGRGEATSYYARDEVVPVQGAKHADFEAEAIGDDLGAALDESGKPYHHIPLARGAPVQLMQTLDTRAGLIKGTNAIVDECKRHSVVIRLRNGRRFPIPRTTFKYKPRRFRGCVEINRHQLPLALNWASTVHRVQGDTLDRVVFDLRHPVFTHGQLYSGVTRVQRRASLRMLVPRADFADNMKTFRVVNVVMPELLGQHFHYINEGELPTPTLTPASLYVLQHLARRTLHVYSIERCLHFA